MKLCYEHHKQEFDALPNIRRGEASGWETVDSAECEACHKAIGEKLSHVLDFFDVDLFKEGKAQYIGQLWQDGGVIAECQGATLAEVIKRLDTNADALVSYW